MTGWAWFGLGVLAGVALLIGGSWLYVWTYGRTR